MISQTAEYALRAAVFLGSTPGSSQPVREIASFTHIPASYLTKILGLLGRAGIVQGQRGPNGGFTLGREPAAVSVLEVIRAVEPWAGLDTCPLGLPEHSGKLCPLHRHLADAYRQIEDAFRSTTLKDLVATAPSTDCPFPTAPNLRSRGADDRAIAPTPARPARIKPRPLAPERRRRGGSSHHE